MALDRWRRDGAGHAAVGCPDEHLPTTDESCVRPHEDARTGRVAILTPTRPQRAKAVLTAALAAAALIAGPARLAAQDDTTTTSTPSSTTTTDLSPIPAEPSTTTTSTTAPPPPQPPAEGQQPIDDAGPTEVPQDLVVVPPAEGEIAPNPYAPILQQVAGVTLAEVQLGLRAIEATRAAAAATTTSLAADVGDLVVRIARLEADKAQAVARLELVRLQVKKRAVAG